MGDRAWWFILGIVTAGLLGIRLGCWLERRSWKEALHAACGSTLTLDDVEYDISASTPRPRKASERQ